MVLPLDGTHLIAVLDLQGNVVVGRVLSADNQVLPRSSSGSFGDLSLVNRVLSTDKAQAGTQIIPAEFLQQAGLDRQAAITLIDTSKAAATPFGSARVQPAWP